MASETLKLKLTRLEPNEGQLEGVPANPRDITEDKMELLKKDIQDYPEMLDLRELLVYKLHDKDKYVIIGGNMRYRALLSLGIKEAPCKVIPDTATIKQLKAYAILDNSGFGKWNWDLLANEWDLEDLKDWGIDLDIKSDIDFDDVSEITGENFEVPKSKMIICPKCGHRDFAIHFRSEMSDTAELDDMPNSDTALSD